jgi:hypothetical protein
MPDFVCGVLCTCGTILVYNLVVFAIVLNRIKKTERNGDDNQNSVSCMRRYRL